MVDWTYNELKNVIREDIYEFERDRDYNYSPGQVAGRCFCEYTTVCSSGYTETMIVYTEIGMYIINKCSQESIELYSKKLRDKFISFRREKLNVNLAKEEIDELEKKVNIILKAISKY